MTAQLPISIRNTPPHPDAAKLAESIHTGGVWIWQGKAWKPLDGRPFMNADCHTPTREAECLAMMASAPAFPRNWEVRESNGRRWLVRDPAYIVPADIPYHEMQLEDVLTVERGVRALNAKHWSLGDGILQVAYDRRGRVFILDLSAAYHERSQCPPLDHLFTVLRWFKDSGFDGLYALRKNAEAVVPDLLVRRFEPDKWPSPDHEHVYASRSRPVSRLWCSIPDVHLVDSNYAETGVWTWVVTPRPLDADTLYRYELVWGWSPVVYERR